MAQKATVEMTYLDDHGETHKLRYEGVTHYLPKSQVTLEPNEPDYGDEVQVEIPEWLALKEGLI